MTENTSSNDFHTHVTEGTGPDTRAELADIRTQLTLIRTEMRDGFNRLNKALTRTSV